MSYGRTRKQAKLDEEKTFDDIIKRGPRESAKRQMQHEAYQSIEVMDYIRKIHKGGGADGNDKRAISIVQEQPTRNH
ncbi:MAG: hypothetical protein E7K23_13320 [Lachnospiraceae bacterium]|nr:hypothetical protein [Lachnospiraceae bacterium]